MKVNAEMNLSQKAFFEYLTQSLMIDVFKNSDQFKSENEIKKGLRYKKKFTQVNGKELEADVEIMEFKKPMICQSKIMIGSNTNYVSFEIDEIDEEHIHVAYTESYDSTKRLNVWNFRFMNFVLSHVNKKKMKRMLKAMENHILSKESSL